MRNTDNKAITQEMLTRAVLVEVMSGEGELGTIDVYRGKKTVRAVRTRLTKERCGGDRWAILVLDGERI